MNSKRDDDDGPSVSELNHIPALRRVVGIVAALNLAYFGVVHHRAGDRIGLGRQCGFS
jgi:hypothetical protein